VPNNCGIIIDSNPPEDGSTGSGIGSSSSGSEFPACDKFTIVEASMDNLWHNGSALWAAAKVSNTQHTIFTVFGNTHSTLTHGRNSTA
jgi:hypothetical protein